MSKPIDEQAWSFAEGAARAEAPLAQSLSRLRQHDAELGAFLHVSEEAATRRAQELDRRPPEARGPLAGLPVALKDSLCTTDAPTTAASRILQGYTPPYEATAVTRLRDAGALLIGKTNMDEFGMGSSSEHSAFFPVKNPWDLARTPGGSSGGSAAAVAARIVPAALGSDTGGSVRQPAAFCGVVGLKPSYGRVSRYGLIAYASSLDQIGVLADGVQRTAQVFDAIAGPDPRDATCAPQALPPVAPALSADLRGVAVGVLDDWFSKVIDPGLRAQHELAKQALRDAGATLKSVRWPEADHAVATYYVIASAEASSNLARYDGIRFGQPGRGASLHERIVDARTRGFGAEVKRRILLGAFVLSSGYYDAYYKRAIEVRAQLRRGLEALLAEHTLLVGPVTPELPFLLGARTTDVMAMYASDLFTLPASLAGAPAASVPIGTASSESGGRLPAALQLIGRVNDERSVLSGALALEQRFGPELPPLTLAANTGSP